MQLLSITETQYSSEDILIISPDSDNLSVLQAAILGVDIRQHRAFALPTPGSVAPLRVADRSFDASPRRLACPNPPTCR
jgi:hypothetical protein